MAFEPCSETEGEEEEEEEEEEGGTPKECNLECTFYEDLCGWQDASELSEAQELTDKTLKPFERVEELNPKCE